MDSALVFPYFLARLLSRAGCCDCLANWTALILSSACVVNVAFCPFHPRLRAKVTMISLAWIVILLAAAGCIWECADAQREGQSPRKKIVPNLQFTSAHLQAGTRGSVIYTRWLGARARTTAELIPPKPNALFTAARISAGRP
jgi:hypothetical protein